MKKIFLLPLIAVLGFAIFSTSTFAKVAEKPKNTKDLKDVPASSNYTSVIIDCTGIFLVRAMSPVLLDAKYNEIYPGSYAKYMKLEEIMEGRIITYEKDLAKAKANFLAGKKPLILKPIGIEGIIKSNPMLSRQDAIKLKLAELDGKFMASKKVIFVY
ncbi:MAG: hypothetical protein AABZ74_15425 [Cyanobacteriota bacterium]